MGHYRHRHHLPGAIRAQRLVGPNPEETHVRSHQPIQVMVPAIQPWFDGAMVVRPDLHSTRIRISFPIPRSKHISNAPGGQRFPGHGPDTALLRTCVSGVGVGYTWRHRHPHTVFTLHMYTNPLLSRIGTRIMHVCRIWYQLSIIAAHTHLTICLR